MAKEVVWTKRAYNKFDRIEMGKIASIVGRNRNRYINVAIDFYNRLHKGRLLSKQLNKESKLVSNDSMNVLAEFEKLNDGK
jgi:hypothetical protein